MQYSIKQKIASCNLSHSMAQIWSCTVAIKKEISDSSSKPSFLYGSNCDVIYAYPIDASRASLPQEEPPKSKRGLEVYNTLYGEMARVSSFTLYRLLN